MTRTDYDEVIDRTQAEKLSIGDRVKLSSMSGDGLAIYKITKLESKEAGIRVQANLVGDDDQ